MTNVAIALGVDSEKWHFVDVLGLDPASLLLLPTPCVSLVLLFPTTAQQSSDDALEVPESCYFQEDVIFVRQQVGGTCGSIAVLHAIVNNLDTIQIEKGNSLLSQFLEVEPSLSHDQMGSKLSDMLLDCRKVAEVHADSPAPAGIRQGRHYCTFCCAGSTLLELDGRRKAPLCHGPTSSVTFVHDAARIVQKRIDSVQDQLSVAQHSFSLLALVPQIMENPAS